MRLKKAVAIFGSLILVVVIFIVFSAKDLTLSFPNKKSISQDMEENKWVHFQDKINQIQKDLDNHNNAVHDLKLAMKQMLKSTSSVVRDGSNEKAVGAPPYIEPDRKYPVSMMMYESTCPMQLKVAPRTNVQMLEMYKSLKFDNPDGGVWKQGWKIEVDEKEWNRQNKLKVFVVPHSHNDPGWIKTVEEYYTTQTKHILDNMLVKLPEDSRRKFIWAEISYFSMWWDDLSEEERDIVKKLIKTNQLEIVTGGWVMNDEANSHWISIVNQLTEGHQWLQEKLNYTPVSSWSIDPFGMSLTQPALLKASGMQNMLIQRVHYSVKKELAQNKQLEFRWRQLWDEKGKTDMFTHMMPFYSYDVPHTCGPDPKICCQFDFKRLPHHGLYCPWKVSPQEITDKNVAQRAELLLDQYRKKSKLYKTNVVLAPLGDDFRYDHSTEWDVQYNNYQKLFDYMNSNLKLNVQAQFGTLTDYFDAVHKEKKMGEFPTLSGDFFTYADRDDHYWSGYYTSRPFYKRMDRILLSYIKAAETIQTLAHLSGKPGSSWIVDPHLGLEGILSNARKALSLFQHHDGVTGTAKDFVVVDYGKKMLLAINGCQKVLQICTHVLLNGYNADTPNLDMSYYTIDDLMHSHDSLIEHSQITIGVPYMPTKKVVIFNPLAFKRTEVVSFHVSTPFVEVTDGQGKTIDCQLSPVFEYGPAISQTKYQLHFVATVPALGLAGYTIRALEESDIPKETHFAAVKILNHYDDIAAPKSFHIEVLPQSSEFTLRNERITASFNELGLLKAIKTKTDGNVVPVHLDFAKYGVRNRNERSGAYLFLPDGDAIPLDVQSPTVNLIEGRIFSSVTLQLPYVRHTATLYDSPGADGLGLEIENIVDISTTSNFELVMRLSTNIESGEEYFTDVNGYQIMRRKRFKKIPLQANYYPIPTMAYIEDKKTRISIVTSGPLGCASLNPGQIEVMLDRRLNQDDNLGLGQGVMDNKPTRHTFRVILEKRENPACKTTADNHPAGFPSMSTYLASQTLLNPAIRLMRTDDDDVISQTSYAPVVRDLGVDFSVAALRTNVLVKGKKRVGVTLHRQYLDLCYADKQLLRQFSLSDGTANISSILPMDDGKKLYKTSLSFSLVKNEVDGKGNIAICPMDIQSFIL
ncbi:unnamed protein product [Brassicogethes aeneus]|uniref:Alpha-mannosidase n=1 Tax=Brassicogethes aeneus TaxID=1431903 RepID=A0A9P0AYA9_BRAAE|nr:unnamed protein product [Brassicogethes aeneus]